MMKKMIALVMVIGMASLASAGLVLSGEGAVASITGEGNGTVGQAAFFGIIGGSTDAGITMLYAGNAAGSVGYAAYIPYASVAVDALYFVEFTDLSATPPSADGLLATWDLALGDTIVMFDGDLQEVASFTAVPEPLTLGLIGLGGLLIRRRK